MDHAGEVRKAREKADGRVGPWQVSRSTAYPFASTIFPATQSNTMQETRQDGPSLARGTINYTPIAFAVLSEGTSLAHTPSLGG
mmetsp:Transcript_8048/g.49685  ORF Transcript_8048/g.49685 Transcript_8048/m.49685 type:complete len:84 (-) Transcript_8048:891-1142(-)